MQQHRFFPSASYLSLIRIVRHPLSVGPRPQKPSVLQMGLLASAACLLPERPSLQQSGELSGYRIRGRAQSRCGILVTPAN